MKAKVRIENPAQVSLTISMTMPLEDWKSLLAQIDGAGWPRWKVAEIIQQSVNKATQTLEIDTEME